MAHLFKGESKYCGLLAIKKSCTMFGSMEDAMTNHNIAQKAKNAPFNLIGCVGLGSHPIKKCLHALLFVFASDKYDVLE